MVRMHAISKRRTMSKHKIGIVTITNDGYNFGNRLQNYALQTILERMGYDVETLNRPIRGNQRLWWKRKKMVLHYFLPYRRKIVHLKAGNFYFWNRRYIKWSNRVATDDILPLLGKQYDYLIAGSDQIWNPKFIWGEDPYMFLQFAKPEQRIAYSPSIGLDEIPQVNITQYEDWWRDWNALSCREYTGANIISRVINKKVPTLIDPTLLLSSEDWCRLTKGIKTPKKYIFVYMLGEITGEYKEYIDKLAHENQCEVVDVMNDIRYAGGNPSVFVALIQNAERVIADSYHAMVFAMLFHLPFTFIDRVGWGMNMNSRVETLMRIFDIHINKLEAITEMQIDWDVFERKLETERQKAIKYLSVALQ